MSDVAGVSAFNPFNAGLQRSQAAGGDEDDNRPEIRTPADQAQSAARDPAGALIENVRGGIDVAARQATATDTDTEAPAAGRDQDQVTLSADAQQALIERAEANRAAANENVEVAGQTPGETPPAGRATDELTNTARVDGNEDTRLSPGNRERAQLVDQFA